MKQKVLFVAHMLRGHVLVFHLPYMKWFQEQGYEVHLCSCNDTEKPVTEVPYCDRFFDLPFQRSPFGRQNLQVYREIKKLVDREDYALIHCHTPVGGMVGRLAARGARKRGTRVLYTAHGFHFFTGAPLRNWLLFYPAERFLARFTDLLITINREDEARARRFPARRVARTNGIGVDLSRFEPPADRAAVRAELGIGPDAPMVICVGEHSVRKNHETVLRACAGEKVVQVFFSGVGEREDSLRELAAELGMAERTHFLGFRPDVPALLQASDVFLFPSLQEGLPMAQMEAMAAGLPCLVSNVRGNADLIGPMDGGMLRAPMDAEGFRQDLHFLLEHPEVRREMGERNRRVIRDYSLNAVLEQMAALYREELEAKG